MINLIIPTYNEERYLPRLLDSIDMKMNKIVADSSYDNTRKIARKRGCIVVKGGKPAVARNNGAKACKGDLLFVDCDAVFPKGFLKGFLGRIEKDKLDYATCFVKPITKKSWINACYFFKNWGNYLFPNHVSGQCFYVKRELFDKVKGYDETLFLGEEHELASRLKKNEKGRFYRDIHVLNHPRRLEKEGISSFLKDICSEIVRFKGPLRKKIYERQYGHY